MRNNRLLTGTLCAVLLAAMTACQAYIDTSAGSSSSAETVTAVVAEAAASMEAAESAEGADADSSDGDAASGNSGTTESVAETSASENNTSSQSAASDSSSAGTGTTTSGSSSKLTGADVLTASSSDLFTERDLEQTADLTGATKVTVSDGDTVSIKTEGVYVLTGTAANAQVVVEAGDEDKVQLVLDGVSITNDSTPCIYVKNADKVFVTTTDSENTLTVSGTFTADETTNTDAVIFSKDDLVLNGKGTLTISSTGNGITSKDDLKITGGTIEISCTADALEANDSIRIADGRVTIKTTKDGLHAENDEDSTLGYVYIGGGTLTVDAGDDAIHATTVLRVDSGTMDLTAREAMEGTYIQVNDGTITIAATDDAINAGQKSNISTPTFEINGGTVTVTMGQGDTDAIDSNGNLILNGGTLDITAQSPFDYDGTAENNGTTIIVNGTETDTITNQMMGGGHGGMGGGMRGGMDGGMQGGTDSSGSTDGSGGMGGGMKGGMQRGMGGHGGFGGMGPREMQGGMNGGANSSDTANTEGTDSQTNTSGTAAGEQSGQIY